MYILVGFSDYAFEILSTCFPPTISYLNTMFIFLVLVSLVHRWFTHNERYEHSRQLRKLFQVPHKGTVKVLRKLPSVCVRRVDCEEPPVKQVKTRRKEEELSFFWHLTILGYPKWWRTRRHSVPTHYN